MCVSGQFPRPVVPATASEALAMAEAGLAWLASADATGLAAAGQAQCLRALERAESLHTAARAAVLTAFTAGQGFEDDGQGSPRTWLKWQTRITGAAAAGAVGWMRRLAAHPAVRDALAAAGISASWARQICDWTDLLAEDVRGDADVILLAAAAAGAELAGLARLAEEIRARTAHPDRDQDGDGFDDRAVRLATTFRGAGRLDGDLTPQCAVALRAVLDALGKRAGPQDTRTKRQRDHDALEEACRRLIAAGGLPDRAGQPTQILLHMSLADLLREDGADRETGAAAPTWPGRAAAGPGASCDAAIVPLVTGRIDSGVLDRLAAALLRSTAGIVPGSAVPGPAAGPPSAAAETRQDRTIARDRSVAGGRSASDTGPQGGDIGAQGGDAARRERTNRAIRDLITGHAVALLSGPGGLAAAARTGLGESLVTSTSLPLDVGAVTDTIPVHLRRAVTARDGQCRFPGCDQPPAACQPHHLIPRAEGGTTSLANLLLLCSFHHLIAIHRWNWAITLHPDGRVTAVSPDGSRILHGPGPPAWAA
ncbi:MAG: DUF222 domain-containing protein [Streptosporangiaceae bacterium]